MNTIKIFNLNLHNYDNFVWRKPKIINIIRKNKPDIVVFQEVRDDLQFNENGNNQAEQLNEKLRYKNLVFFPVTDKRKERPERYKLRCIEGTAILSKFPILKIKKVKLKKEDGDIYNCGNLHVKIDAGKPVDIIAVHFSPNDVYSKLHLIETLKYAAKKKIVPIIIGDFNIIKSEILDSLTKKNFASSLKYKRYISYPKGKFTLDYILIPKNFKFKSLKCIGRGLSDHKALLTEVEIK